ncbi:MAG TPA: cytochrome c oxidase assembly factor Coa1 family protein [Alphaproteobacteria bacterium]|nr:cytochrome c oxidase assembly factor Coa1 family protein [Alphaproteobacteria bacterium]
MSKGEGRVAVAAAPASAKPWFGRNWKWLLPIMMAVPIFLIAIFASRMVRSVSDEVTGTLKSSEPYQHAVETATHNAQVLQQLGAPVQPGGDINGAINVSEKIDVSGNAPSDSSGSAEFTIPLKGTLRKGTLHVVARKSAGKWRYQTMQVDVEGSSSPIDLLGSWDQAEGK